MRLATLVLGLALQLAAAPPAPDLQVAAPLSFGGLLAQAGGGRVTLTADGSLLPEGPGVFPGASPAAAYARLRLRGPANGRYHLRVVPGTPTLAGSGGGTVRVAAFTVGPAWDGALDGTGEAEVDLGGTLDIPAGTPAGRFSATVVLQLTVEGLPSVTRPLTVACTVRSPLALATLAPLDFAAILAGDGGRFEVRAAGGHTESGRGPRLVKGAPHPAVFRLTGPARTSYTLILPTDLVLTGPGGPLRVRDFSCDQPTTGTLPAGGLTFRVGAALMVEAQQEPGVYQGIFQVRVAYP